MVFPIVAALAWKVLAVLATSEQSEWLLSKAGRVITNQRSSPGSGNIEMFSLSAHRVACDMATDNNNKASKKRPRS